MARQTVRLATRGSALALSQARAAKTALEGRRFEVELVEVETKGDQIRDELIHELGTTGAFVRSLDQEVLSGEVDAAVHSMKDVPTDSPDDLVVAAIPERGPPGDLLVTPDGTPLEDLPSGATVGTSSLRRGAQLLARRPDLAVASLRGNVDTRVEKLLAPSLQREHERRLEADEGETDEGFTRSVDEWFADLPELHRLALERRVEQEYDAIVLAAAGIERSDLGPVVDAEPLVPREFVPAPGQGALAVTSRDTELAASLHDALDHPRTRVETTVERTILATLGGGCVAPIGVYAVLQGEQVRTTVGVYSQDGTESVEATRSLPVERHADAAREFARELDERGAGELIAAARADEPRARKRGEE